MVTQIWGRDLVWNNLDLLLNDDFLNLTPAKATDLHLNKFILSKKFCKWTGTTFWTELIGVGCLLCWKTTTFPKIHSRKEKFRMRLVRSRMRLIKTRTVKNSIHYQKEKWHSEQPLEDMNFPIFSMRLIKALLFLFCVCKMSFGVKT